MRVPDDFSAPDVVAIHVRFFSDRTWTMSRHDTRTVEDPWRMPTLDASMIRTKSVDERLVDSGILRCPNDRVVGSGDHLGGPFSFVS